MPRPRYRSPESAGGKGQPSDQLPLETLCVVIPRQSTLAAGKQNEMSQELNPDDMVAYAHRLGFERVRVLD